MTIFSIYFNEFSTFWHWISSIKMSQNPLQNCIQDSMAQKKSFLLIKSPQKQLKSSLRRSKTPPRSPYDVPRRPKTPPRRSQEKPRGPQDPSKTPPRRLQEAPKTSLKSSQELGRWGTPVLVAKMLDFGRFLVDIWSIFNWFLVDFWSIFRWFFIPFQGSEKQAFQHQKTKKQSSKM